MTLFNYFLDYFSDDCQRSPEEAGTYVRALQSLLRSVGASDGNMEQVRNSKRQINTHIILTQVSISSH
jgi:hypothetical protein